MTHEALAVCAQASLNERPRRSAVLRRAQPHGQAVRAAVGRGSAAPAPWPTRAPTKSSTSRIRRGSSRRSCSAGRRSIRRVRVPVQQLLRGEGGPRAPRARRGMLSRPGAGARCARIATTSIAACAARARRGPARARKLALERLELGLHHEQQHPRAILTDIKYALGTQPLRPAYRDDLAGTAAGVTELRWRRGLRARWEVRRRLGQHPRRCASASRSAARAARGAARRRARSGADRRGGPGRLRLRRRAPRARHNRPAVRDRRRGRSATPTVLAFIADGGYRRAASSWLSGRLARGAAPRAGSRRCTGSATTTRVARLGLCGLRAVDPNEPRRATSAFTRPTRYAALGSAGGCPPRPSGSWPRARPRPRPATSPGERAALPGTSGGQRWARSAVRRCLGVDRERVRALPRLPARSPARVGEYNGKFMSGQQVLRGGSCADAARAHPRGVPQLLPTRRALADVRRARVTKDAEEAA